MCVFRCKKSPKSDWLLVLYGGLRVSTHTFVNSNFQFSLNINVCSSNMSQKESPKANLLANAKAKADEYAIKNDKSGRARTKQAILHLQELNNQ